MPLKLDVIKDDVEIASKTASVAGQSINIILNAEPGIYDFVVSSTARLDGRGVNYILDVTYPDPNPEPDTNPEPEPTPTPDPDPGNVIWHGDADNDRITEQPTISSVGRTVFWRRMEQSNLIGRMNIIDDPLGIHSRVYEAHLRPEDINSYLKRAEWSQINDSDGSKIRMYENGITNAYFGWRSLFGTPDNIALTGADNDGNYMQIKGDSSCGGPAVGLTIMNNRLGLRTIDGDYIAWDGIPMTDLLDNQWHDIVIHMNLSKGNDGYLSIWIDGVPQKMNNGQDRINVPTVCPNDTYVYPKLGVYSMDVARGSGPRHLFDSPRFGTTYASVAPR